LKEKASYRYHEYDLNLYPEYTQLYGTQQGDLFDVIAALRDLDIKINLQRHFQNNKSARQELTESEGVIVSNSKLKAFAFTPSLPNLKFGYVGNIPVAISLDTNGLIEYYYFKFKI
jgi:hypothetical protein